MTSLEPPIVPERDTDRERGEAVKSPAGLLLQAVLGAVLALAISGCEKPAAPQTGTGEPPPTTTSPAPGPAANVVPTPAPVSSATPTPAPVVAQAKNETLAPPGIFFLRARFAANTDDGTVGVRPGTRAEKQPDGRYLVNGRVIAIPQDYLTNDMAVAAQAGAQFNAAEQAARARASQMPAAQPPTIPNAAAGVPNDGAEAAARAAAGATARLQAAAAATAERQRVITEHREAIAALEAKKKTWSSARYPLMTHQRFLNEINDEIGTHTKEMSRLGVAGATLERR